MHSALSVIMSVQGHVDTESTVANRHSVGSTIAGPMGKVHMALVNPEILQSAIACEFKTHEQWSLLSFAQ